MMAGIGNAPGGRMASRTHLSIIVGTAALLLLAAFFAVSVRSTIDQFAGSSEPGWLAGQRGESVTVALMKPGSPAEGLLRRGDEVLALNGRGVRTFVDVMWTFEEMPPGARYRALLRRDGRPLSIEGRTYPYAFGWQTFFIVARYVLAFVFLAGGAVIFYLRPEDKQAVLLASMLALFGNADQLGSFHGIERWLGLWSVVQSAAFLFWPVFLHLFLVFPERSPVLARAPRLEWMIYLPPVVLLVTCMLVFQIVRSVDPLLAFDIADHAPIAWANRSVFITYSLAGLLSLVATYLAASRQARRRLRVVVAGILAGFLPLLVLGVVFTFADFSALNLWVVRLGGLLSLLTLPLVPLAFGYAIVRHQVIPVRLIIRRGVRYLLVARGFILVEAAVLAAALAFALTGARGAALDRLGDRADILATATVGAIVLGLLTFVHRRVMPVIDRRFFREPYEAQKILADLGNAVRSLGSIEELLDRAATPIAQALHLESLRVVLCDEAKEDCRVVVSRGRTSDRSEPRALLETVLRAGGTVETADGGMLVPILTKREPLGVLAVGPRLGDLPFAREDRELLANVAWQMAIAVENSHLVRRMAQEESLRRELRLASEVQRRLFPDKPPRLRRLELAGLCHPARGVGGDYYDFLSLGDGKLGIAVADVAGKGLSAALLMSIVQASLRSHALRDGMPLTELVAAMNQLLYRSTARNSFASFFYAEVDEASGRLTYVNAGHNPPMLLRPVGGSGPEIELLSTGGLVMGASNTAAYEQESVALHPGDLLVAYTDGVTEAWNPEGEEFGEARLRDVVAGTLGCSAEAVAEAVVDAVHVWARDAPQHDDLTLVIAKVL
jgi:sigma-B regulation protein RsbU (phosphoserine phosphatase)